MRESSVEMELGPGWFWGSEKKSEQVLVVAAKEKNGRVKIRVFSL